MPSLFVGIFRRPMRNAFALISCGRVSGPIIVVVGDFRTLARNLELEIHARLLVFHRKRWPRENNHKGHNR